jgi:hypothetical protein
MYEPLLALRVDAEVVRRRDVDRRQGVVLERASEPGLDALADPLGADVVDHELEAGLDARDAILEVLRPDARDCAEDLVRVLLRDEDAEVAGDPRHRGEAAADEDGEALSAFVDGADQRDAVDLGRVAAIGAGGDRVLVLSRQVGPVGVAVEEVGGGIDDRRRVEELAGGDPLDGAPRDIADGVAAAARGRDAEALQVREDVGQLRELEPVQLDVLAGRELAVAATVEVRDLADRAQLERAQLPGGNLDPQHERSDLRLVVVQAPPLEPDDVLLRDVLVAGRDQRGQLVADPERGLLALQPLHRVALEHQLPVGRRLRDGAHRAARPRALRGLAGTLRTDDRVSFGTAPAPTATHCSHSGTKSKVLSVHAPVLHFTFCSNRLRSGPPAESPQTPRRDGCPVRSRSRRVPLAA